MRLLSSLLLLATAACGNKTTTPPTSTLEPDEIPLTLDLDCPGGPSCPDSGDGKLYAATARRDITPLVEPFTDVNGNGRFDLGEPYGDLNGNGRFDPVYLAGRNSGTLAFGVHDPVWTRCYVLRQNASTLAHCVLDTVGFFQDEVAQIRANLDPALGIDLLLVGSTHNHQNQDTMGQWGPDDFTSGYDEAWMKRVRLAVVDAVTEAVGKLKPARLALASIAMQEESGDMSAYVHDSRDPVVIDNRLHILQFDGADDGKPIVTVVNWSAHPDSLGTQHRYISSDFVHYLRESVEAGTGSDVVYVTGSVGGQIGPGDIKPLDDMGQPYPADRSFHFIDVWGRSLGRMALKAFARREAQVDPKLRFRHTTFNVHVENVALQTGAALGLFHRSYFGFDKKKPLIKTDEFDNRPLVVTEASYITLGAASMITAPGEVCPELFVGGYDGSRSGTQKIVDTTLPNAADITRAPKGPYLFDLMDGPPEHHMLFGLTMDMLGYFVARFNFVLDELAPYLAEAAGDHYEETNSVGPNAEPEIIGTMRQLVTYKKP